MMVWRLSDAYGRLSHEVENEALDGKRLVESGADASRWDRRSFYLKDFDAGGVINNSVVCAGTRDRKFLPSDKPVVSHWLSDVYTPVRPDIEIGSVRSIMTAMAARIRIFPPSGGHSDDWRYRFSLRAGWMAGRPSPRRTDGRDAYECRRHPPCHRRDDMRRARKSIKMIANAIVIRPQHHTVWDSIR